jgi:hypothetical protein
MLGNTEWRGHPVRDWMKTAYSKKIEGKDKLDNGEEFWTKYEE